MLSFRFVGFVVGKRRGGGFSVSKSGNSMTVYTKSVNTTATLGSFKSTIGAVDTTSSCVFWLTGNSGDQEFVSEQPSADPISAYIKVKTENIEKLEDLEKVKEI